MSPYPASEYSDWESEADRETLASGDSEAEAVTPTQRSGACLTMEELQAAAPDVIFIAPCGFEQTRAADDARQLWEQEWWCALPAVQSGRVFALDANLSDNLCPKFVHFFCYC